MPRRQAITAADFAASERSNVRILPEGAVELSTKNLLGNPALLKLDAEGDPVGWDELIGPPAPIGWHVYDKMGSANGRQTTSGPLPLSQTSYTQAAALTSGITHLNKGTALPGAPEITAAPAVSAVTASSTLGLAAGYYGVALAWITAAESAGGLLTLPSTRVSVNLLVNQRITVSDLPLLSEAPAGAYGVAVLTTAMQATDAAALLSTTPLYLQQVYTIGSLPTSATVSGPIRTDRPATLAAGPDPTAVGASGTYGAPEYRITPSFGRTIPASLSLQLSWRFMTPTGMSAAQGSLTITPTTTSGAGVEMRPPLKPARAMAWQPLYKASGAAGTLGTWQAGPAWIADFREYAFAMDASATVLPGLPTLDESGIAAPDVPSAVANTAALPVLTGTHKIRASWAYGDGTEGSASPQASAVLTSTQTFTVTKPTLAAGSCSVLLNPTDRPAALTGVNHNQIQYVGPVGAPQDYRICRYAPRTVIKAGSQYTVSAYVKATSITEASLFEMVFRDANGVVLGNAVPMATLAAGTYAWTRYTLTLTAPTGAVFLEVYGHRVGAGTILIAAPQAEAGATATTYSAGTVASGTTGYAIVSWNTQPAEFQGQFGSVTGFSTAQAVIDSQDGHTYTVSYASSTVSPTVDPASNWTFFTSIGDVVFRNYLAAKIQIVAP